MVGLRQAVILWSKDAAHFLARSQQARPLPRRPPWLRSASLKHLNTARHAVSNFLLRVGHLGEAVEARYARLAVCGCVFSLTFCSILLVHTHTHTLSLSLSLSLSALSALSALSFFHSEREWCACTTWWTWTHSIRTWSKRRPGTVDRNKDVQTAAPSF